MRPLMQNPSMRALMIVSMGMSFTACMAENSIPNVHSNDMNRVKAQRYASSYQVQNRTAAPYVLMAQNNAAPNLRAPRLRGMSPNPSVVQRQFYQDYPAQSRTHYVPRRVDTQNVISKQSFNHHLDDARAEQFSAVQHRAVQPRSLNHHLEGASTMPQRHYVQRPQTTRLSSQYQASEQVRGAQSSVQPRASQLNYEQQQNETAYESAGSSTFVGNTASSSTVSPNSVNRSVNYARSQSPRLAIEELKIKEAEEGLVQAKSQGRFKLNFDSSVGVSQSETDFNVIDRTDTDTRLKRAARLDLSLPLYQGGQIKAQKNVAKVGIKTAEANYEVVENAVTQEAAIAHLNVIQDRQLIQVYARNVELLKDQKQNVEAMVNAGENTVTDAALIDARLASIEARLEQSKANLAVSESTYKKLVGSPAPSLMPVGTVDLPSSLQEIKEVAQINNAQIKAVETQEEAAFHNIMVAKSFGRPKLSLQGILRGAEGQSETISRDTAAELLLNLNVPLLSGGENKSRVRQAALAQTRAVLETRELHDNLNERVEQLWASVQSARRSQAPNQAQKIAAQKAYAAITKQRNAGLATSLDVLSVEQTLLDAEINLLQAQNREDVARFQLLGLMGAL